MDYPGQLMISIFRFGAIFCLARARDPAEREIDPSALWQEPRCPGQNTVDSMKG
jgi:hypothetical protein